MKIVVTGGAGFIASHVVDAYLDGGHEVHIIDDFSTGQSVNVNSQATLHQVDIAEKEAARLIEQIKPDVLSHHAAQMDVRHSVADGVSKRAGELYLSYYHQAFGLPYIALRYANVYGPRQSAKGEAGVVAIFLSALLAGKTPVINGDGRQTRDYVYVGDVVAANVAALQSSFIGPINIGTGVETDVVTIYQHLRQAVGSPIEAQHGPAKPGEQRRSCLDAGCAAQILGWRPQMTLKDGLWHTVDYCRKSVGR